MSKLLLIQSDFKMQLALRCWLTYKGFNVTVCSTISQAKKVAMEATFTMILIDIHLQDEDAFAFMKSLRMKGHYAPVLFIGERAYQEKLSRECTGLDEYLLKPLSIQNLKDGVQKVLSKSHSTIKPLLYGGIEIDEKHRRLSVREKMVELGRMEMKILILLSKKAGKVVTLDHIHSLLEQEGKFNIKLFSYVSSLRKKLEDAGVHTLKINFVKDGYRLDVV